MRKKPYQQVEEHMYETGYLLRDIWEIIQKEEVEEILKEKEDSKPELYALSYRDWNTNYSNSLEGLSPKELKDRLMRFLQIEIDYLERKI